MKRTFTLCAALALAVIGFLPASAMTATAASTSAPVASQPQWQSEPFPSPTFRTGSFADVSCPTASSCTAVGDVVASATPTIKTWNGSRWQSSKIPPRAEYMSFVSCPTRHFCVALGDTQAEVWAGGHWRVVALASGTDAQLNGLSCASKSFCVAVGQRNSHDTLEPFAEEWNGHGWSVARFPALPNSRDSFLSGVSCAKPGSCTAIGRFQGAHRVAPLSETLAQGHWKDATILDGTNTRRNDLLSVSCVRPTDCIAVGSQKVRHQDRRALIADRGYRRDWHQTTIAPASGRGQRLLTSLSCSSIRLCAAVGVADNAHGRGRALAASLTNGRWRVDPSAAKAPVGQSTLSGVACPARARCIAVGEQADGINSDPRSLTETGIAGRWVRVDVRDARIDRRSDVDALGCGAATFCVMSGEYSVNDGTDYPQFTGVEAGSGWQISAPPTPDGWAKVDFYTGLSCGSTSSCTLIGYGKARGGSGNAFFAQAWNGIAWTTSAIPAPATADNAEVEGTPSCLSVTFCVAVGRSSITDDPSTGDGHFEPVASMWNGTTWTSQLVAPPAGYKTVNGFAAVSCSSTTDCTAVGEGETPNEHVFTSHWDGATWSSAPLPDPDHASTPYPSAISCAPGGSCLVLGSASTPDGNTTYLERNRGTSWSTVALPEPKGGKQVMISDVACPSDTDCYAVGSFRDSAKRQQPLAARLSGDTWQVQSVDDPARSGQLSHVSCPAAGACIAAGTYPKNHGTAILIDALR